MQNESLAVLLEEIEKIAEVEKCLACGCFYDTLLQLQEVLEKEKNLAELKERLVRVMEKVNVAYDCLGCEPCYPVPVANTVAEMLEGPSLCTTCGPACAAVSKKEEAPSWPVEPGEYLVGDPQAPVAVSTLGSDTLPEVLAEKLGRSKFAIMGKTHTENIGLEKIVKNTISNPYIRFLILCGKDTGGHWAGQSLLSLINEGVNHEKRIIGSRGKRPILKNLEFSALEHFRSQLEIIDLIGLETVAEIKAKLEACIQKNPGRFHRTLTVKKIPPIEAYSPEKLVLDSLGFFIIYSHKTEGKIYLEHYRADGTLNEVVYGSDPALIASTAIERGLLSRLEHAAYLGRELEKAYLSMIYGFPYNQDRAPGHLGRR